MSFSSFEIESGTLQPSPTPLISCAAMSGTTRSQGWRRTIRALSGITRANSDVYAVDFKLD
jgi:hypothetical protein